MLKITQKNELLAAANKIATEEQRIRQQAARNKKALNKWRKNYYLATCIIPILSKTA